MFGISLYKILAVVIGVMLLVGYFKYTQDKMAELNQAVAQKEFALEVANTTIEKQQDAIKQQAEIAERTNEEYTNARREVEDLRQKFNKFENLDKSAAETPEVIETKINRATKRVIDCTQQVVNRGKGNGC
jgi:chromosome segregation ATPase